MADPFPDALFQSECLVPGNLLNEGKYRVSLLIVENSATIVYQYDHLVTLVIQDQLEDRALVRHMGRSSATPTELGDEPAIYNVDLTSAGSI